MECQPDIANLSGTISERPANHNVNCEVPSPVEAGGDGDQISESRLQIVGFEMAPGTEQNNEASPENQSKENQEAGTKNKPRIVKPKDEVTFRTHITSLAHLSVLIFVYMVIKLAFRDDFELFTWHPILMSLGWMLMMTQGFYSINKYNTYWRLKTKGGFRVKVHVTLLAVGYVLSVIGFVVVYVNKNLKNKHHFVSWHAIFGLIGLIATVPPVINGTILWYKKELARYVDHPRLVKFMHVLTGSIAFSFGALSLVLSVYTKWYARRSNGSNYIFYAGLFGVTFPLAWAVYGPAVKLARVVKEYFSENKED